MFVYLITNNMNNKEYVGQTIKSISVRWSQHVHAATTLLSNNLLHKAIRKYGKNNFTYKIIDTASSIEDLNKKEFEWIKKRNTHYIFGNGYNMAIGGNSNSGWKEDKEKTAKRIDKIKKRIICEETGQIFESILQTAKYFETSPGFVRNVACGIKPSCKGFHFNYLDKELREKSEQKRLKKIENIKTKYSLGRPVICVTNGEEYRSIKEAARQAKCAEISMYKHLKRLRKTCKGLIFEYKDKVGK